ncbi:MAG: molybdopterin oxidoreductase family protein [Burkholderiaceae bacterium]
MPDSRAATVHGTNDPALRVVRGACPHDCPDSCAMLVHVQGGVAIRVTGNPDHLPTAGTLCAKVARYVERTYHHDRLLHPQKRVGAKGEGRFVRIGWDEALGTSASRLSAIAAVDPERILPYSYAGTMGLVQGEAMAQRFFHKLGASRLHRSICAEAGSVGYAYTLGRRMGTDIERVQDAKLIVFWGANAIASSLHFWSRAQEAKRHGARLIAIDPYRSLTAEKCHVHIAPLPGTDSAFALGVMHVLIRDGLVDDDYVARHTIGYDDLAARAATYTPQYVAGLSGVAAEAIESFAREYGLAARGGEGALIRVNYGVQRTHGGGMAVRNIACLPALVGAFRHAAGGILLSTSGAAQVDRAALTRPDLLAGRDPRTINMTTIGDDLLRPDSRAFKKIDALIVYNANPVAIAPQSRRVAAGFAREDLFTVVLEHFQTDTADYADILLPATTQLEHFDVVRPYGHYDMMVNQPAIAPLGESKPNTRIFGLLAKRMGYDEACFDDDDETIAAAGLARSGVDFEAARARGWARLTPVPPSVARFADGGFPTESGKVEFRSARAQADGLDPLPAWIVPHEDTRSALSRRFPLAMISPPARNFLNSTFVNVASLRAAEGEPWLDVHPDDAAARDIADGGQVRVFNERGSMQLRARVTDRARRGLVVALSIWWKKLAPDGRNANELTGQALTDMGQAPTFYDCLVEIERASSEGQSARC